MDPPQPQAPILLTALLACALQIVWLRVESSLRKAQSMSMLSMSTIQQPEKHKSKPRSPSKQPTHAST
jgi:hypothetical protein